MWILIGNKWLGEYMFCLSNHLMFNCTSGKIATAAGKWNRSAGACEWKGNWFSGQSWAEKNKLGRGEELVAEERISKWLIGLRLKLSSVQSVYCRWQAPREQLLKRGVMSVNDQGKALDFVFLQVPWKRKTFWCSYWRLVYFPLRSMFLRQLSCFSKQEELKQ